MIRESLFFCLLIAGLFTHCGSGQVPHPGEEEEEEEAAVAEAVFSYQIQHRPLERNQEIYFLQIEGNKDPTAALMNRLTDKKYSVQFGSKATVLQGLVEDKDTKKFGILLVIRNRTCASVNQCEVEASIESGSDSVEGWHYELDKENNQWVVKKAQLSSIS